MGSLFKRKDSRFWWIGFTDANGKRRNLSTETEDEAQAKKMLSALERKIRAEKESGLAESGPVTVQRYADKWIEERQARGVASWKDDKARLQHSLKRLGHMKLTDVRVQHVRDFVRELEREETPLAPRSILHAYAVLRVMFNDAMTEELVTFSPCQLRQRRGELPKKRDADPKWRHTAVFTRDEVEALISDPRIPAHHRVIYAIEFLAGLRINEVTPRRWRDYDPEAKPLGKLVIASTYLPKTRTEKVATKTGLVREVPVHPTLASVLASWRLSGWEQQYGRPPKADDLLVPSQRGEILHSHSTLRMLHGDLTLLGLRLRRQHDARRTFVSLGISDGARKDILRWVSHGPEGDVVDLYTTIPWATLCAEVAHLNIRLRKGRVLQLSK